MPNTNLAARIGGIILEQAPTLLTKDNFSLSVLAHSSIKQSVCASACPRLYRIYVAPKLP